MRVGTQKQTGFTIVELLIVVVVIAILAVITIVSFNGIQNRAKESAAKTTAAQATRKLALLTVGTGTDTYPTDKSAFLDATGLKEEGGVTYQYTATPDQKSFCLTTTKDSISYYTSANSQSAVSGACAGHGVGGVAPVANRFLDPTFSGGLGVANQSGTSTAIVSYNGSPAAQATTTTASDASLRLQLAAHRWAIDPGQTVYASATIYNATASARSFSLNIRFYDTASTSNIGTQLLITAAPVQLIAPGASYTFTVSGVAPAGTLSVGLNANRTATTAPAVGDVYYIDNVYLSDSAGGYADGNTPGWAWTGAPNASVSTGPRI